MNKTTKTEASVADFLSTLDEQRKADCEAIAALMSAATKAEPKMWGPSMVGFGQYHYRYASGREGDWFLCGFSPRKANITLYLMCGLERYNELLPKLGKVTHAKSCLYIKKLSDIDIKVLKMLIKESVVYMKNTYPA